ncbi:MAG: DUF3482 domain-containing protein [Gammaproteobacteria bacterium]|nr:DUF3482 domain-containing protein [Gammaproteobacteria bacterium]MBU1415894.1 DUF3482 domain-containing protein [Gammaproteobacteria bacterium]
MITLTLVSHTNVGKTTLARTLLAQDVGEVRDAPHVTEFTDEHVLLRSAGGAELIVADTPGFGDSVRLASRMRQSGSPLGWFLSAVWDRWRDRAFWASQQVLRHVRDRADVVLYLVNAAEEPVTAGYVASEMELLAWVEKPVLVLLNQMGPPTDAAAEAKEVQRWRDALAQWPLVRAVLPLDAFARCWVQEGALWREIEQSLPADRQAEMRDLRAAWGAQRLATFDDAMRTLAASIARIATARVALDDGGGASTLRQLGSAIGVGKADSSPLDIAQQALQRALDEEVKSSTDSLLTLHSLHGDAGKTIVERVTTGFDWRHRTDEGRAALIGAVASGALTGLAHDIATGGFTLGGGVVAGTVLGALAAAGIARGLNVVRGTDKSWVGWHAEALTPVLRSALLRYLAVAHFGRGRGNWAEGESPSHWAPVVDAALAARADALAELWQHRGNRYDNPGEAESLAADLQPILAAAARETLERLYPGQWPEKPDPAAYRHG